MYGPLGLRFNAAAPGPTITLLGPSPALPKTAEKTPEVLAGEGSVGVTFRAPRA